jgi:transposase
MSDKVILDQVLSMLKKMEVPRFTFVGDRGFYSDQGKTIYKTTPAHGRTWHHLYFDPARKDKTIACFMQKLRALKDELEAEKLIESHMVMYERYFIIKQTPVRGRSVNYNDQAIQEFINSDSCYWVLISTSAKTAEEALEQYRERNGVELYFDDEKNLLDLRRLKNHSEQTIKGKIFVTFISLIILARLRKMVDQIDKKKRRHWSEQDMLRKVETYARVHFEGKYKDVYSTPTAAQRLVFDLLGIPYTFKGKVSTSESEL